MAMVVGVIMAAATAIIDGMGVCLLARHLIFRHATRWCRSLGCRHGSAGHDDVSSKSVWPTLRPTGESLYHGGRGNGKVQSRKSKVAILDIVCLFGDVVCVRTHRLIDQSGDLPPIV
jgi:hypothetical protein